jgi:hypothetical protein
LYPIGEEPTVHRMCFTDIGGSGKPEPALIVAPLMGRNSTAKNNWMDGSPVRIRAFRIPKDPTKDRWVPEVISESLHVVHNISPTEKGAPLADGLVADRPSLLAASYEGVTEIFRAPQQWTARQLGEGNQAHPKSNRGTSEVVLGGLDKYKVRAAGQSLESQFIATIEPWHGHQVVVYTPPDNIFEKQSWDRHVIDEQLKWGHAVACAGLYSPNPVLIEGSYEIIVGVRDNLSDKPGERRGVRIYKAVDKKGTRWARHIVEDGGVAVEALAVGDLNGDGRPDIVAVGRQTGNVRIYWNEGVKK